MSDVSGVRLRELLPGTFEGLNDTVRDVLQNAPPLGGARLAWGFVAEKAGEEIHRVLDLDVFEVLARGWCRARELRKYRNQSETQPDTTVIVHLGEHETPPVPVHPELQVMFGRVPGPELVFTMEVTAKFQSVALSIRNGRITSIGAGEGRIAAQLKYGNVKLHEALKSTTVKLEAAIRFKEPGLEIG